MGNEQYHLYYWLTILYQKKSHLQQNNILKIILDIFFFVVIMFHNLFLVSVISHSLHSIQEVTSHIII
jgi:hypothetical protein